MTPKALAKNSKSTIFRQRMDKVIRRLSTLEAPPEPPLLTGSQIHVEVEVGEQEFAVGNREDGYELQFFKSTIMLEPN